MKFSVVTEVSTFLIITQVSSGHSHTELQVTLTLQWSVHFATGMLHYSTSHASTALFMADSIKLSACTVDTSMITVSIKLWYQTSVSPLRLGDMHVHLGSLNMERIIMLVQRLMITVGKICPALVTDVIASVPLSLPAKYWVSLFLYTLCVHGKHWKLEDMVHKR